MRKLSKGSEKERKKIGSKGGKEEGKQAQVQSSTNVSDRLALAGSPLATLKYFGLFLDKFLRDAVLSAVFGWKLMALLLGVICCVYSIDWKSGHGNVALQWLRSGFSCAFQLSKLPNQYVFSFSDVIVDHIKSIVAGENFSKWNVTALGKLAVPTVVWVAGNTLGNTPLFLLAKYFFLPVNSDLFIICTSVLLPYFGDIAILSGSSRHKLWQFWVLNSTVLFMQNAIIQNSMFAIDTLAMSSSNWIAGNSFKLWLWTKCGDSMVLKTFLALKSFMIVTLIGQALIRMIERCANHHYFNLRHGTMKRAHK